MIVGTVHLCKSASNAENRMICGAHGVVYENDGYTQAFLQNCFNIIMHRKVLHNSQGLCMEFQWQNIL